MIKLCYNNVNKKYIMKKKPVITIILATAHKKRNSEVVAKYIVNIAKKELKNVQIKYIDVKDYLFGRTYAPWDVGTRSVKKWRKMADQSSAFLVVSPEYNFSFPGEFKIAFDCAYEEYNEKPVVVAGVSSGSFGGARAIMALQVPLGKTGMNTLRNSLFFGDVKEFVKMTKNQKDEQYRERVIKSLKALKKHI